MLVIDFFVYYFMLTFEIGTSRRLRLGVSVHAPSLSRKPRRRHFPALHELRADVRCGLNKLLIAHATVNLDDDCRIGPRPPMVRLSYRGGDASAKVEHRRLGIARKELSSHSLGA
jgi:hypothetical protein